MTLACGPAKRTFCWFGAGIMPGGIGPKRSGLMLAGCRMCICWYSWGQFAAGPDSYPALEAARLLSAVFAEKVLLAHLRHLANNVVIARGLATLGC